MLYGISRMVYWITTFEKEKSEAFGFKKGVLAMLLGVVLIFFSVSIGIVLNLILRRV